MNGILYTTGVYNRCLCQIDVVSTIGCSHLFPSLLPSLSIASCCGVDPSVNCFLVSFNRGSDERRLDCFDNGRTKEEEDEKERRCTQERRTQLIIDEMDRREEKTNNLPPYSN